LSKCCDNTCKRKCECYNNLVNPVIAIDEEQMTQAMTNIMKNAVEAMPEGGTLTINLENGKMRF
jgi:signal transduction histidine kinase